MSHRDSAGAPVPRDTAFLQCTDHMETLTEEFLGSLPDGRQFVRVSFRLIVAMLIGAVIGLQRELVGKPAGLRTHMLVAIGTATFVLVGVEMNMEDEALARVIEGIATGLGFLGAGAILKLTPERSIVGLTTAAGIWLTASLCVAAAVGRLGLALIGTALAWLVLTALGRLERRIAPADSERGDH